MHIRPNALCLYRQSILSISFTVTMIWWRMAIGILQGQRIAGGYHKFGGMERLEFCRDVALQVVIINLMARGG